VIDPQFNRIENFPSLENDTVHLHICAVGAPDCCADHTYIAPDCSFFGQCHIWDLIALVNECESDSTFLMHIEFNYQELPVDSVDVFANGEYFGTFPVNNGSIWMEHWPIGDGETGVVSICATGTNACCAADEYENPGCENSNCEINELHVIIGDCTSDSTYVLHILFNYAFLPTDSVVITANGNSLGTFHVHDGNIVLEHFPSYVPNQTTLSVCAQGALDCCAVIEFDSQDCTDGGTCNIYDLVADPIDCQSDSSYLLFIHYFTQNLPGDSIIVTANGNYIGQFENNPEGILIENFPVYDTEFTHITVCAVEAPDCCADFNFQTLVCVEPTCQIDDLHAIIGDCQTDSTYILTLLFTYENLPSDSVQISINGNSLGNFFVNNGGIVLENISDFPPNQTVVSVCAVGTPDCCDVIEVETPNCEGGGTCHLYDLVADVGECTSDSTFSLFFHYFCNNTPVDSVIVTANDLYVGTYPDNPNGFTIENFPRLPGEVTHITVCAVDTVACCDTYEFETPFCTDECIIYNVNVEVFGCTSDTTFGAVIHFEYQNIDAGGFDLYAGDQYLGFYGFNQVPIETGLFPSNETGNYLVTVCESDNTECCTTEEFTGPTCGEDECHIYDLTWTMTECDSNGHFFFILDFDFDHVGDDGFNVIGNGNNYGNFNYDNVPVTIGPFEDNGTDYEFAVFDAAHPACFDIVNPGEVDCGVAVSPVDPEKYFEIFNNGSIPGILAKQDISISLFNANGKLVANVNLNPENYFALNNMTDGFYILIVNHDDQTWPVKLIRTGN
jgi:hypothetical protein